jgi:fatty acid desaturase
MLCFASQRVFDRLADHGAFTRWEERNMREIKIGTGSNLVVAAAAGLAVALAFLLLGGTALGYAIVAAVIVMAVLLLIFGVIV